MSSTAWAPLPFDEWRDTYSTLHMWTQVVGKIALAQAPPLNHSWGVALHLTARGLSTYLLPHHTRSFAIEFDFVRHRLIVDTCDGSAQVLPLVSQSVAEFYTAVMSLLERMGLGVRIWSLPAEIPDPIRFEDDTVHHTYDPAWANRWWLILTQVAHVFTERRAEFIGKSSPVHFFWGAFDLAATRFSGRLAPPREGPRFMREAYSHEVISHGFWPGSGPLREAAFYAYAVPEPDGLKTAPVEPPAAYYHRDLGEFILPYDAVRTSPNPEAALRSFIDSTYVSAATLGRWDRAALERPAIAV
ncbi:MAG TPA: DUF5996 family protein [Vicinamibacterales bacterium]|nr:DUF5996 family protein [Vicinamibacterales bacterium]